MIVNGEMDNRWKDPDWEVGRCDSVWCRGWLTIVRGNVIHSRRLGRNRGVTEEFQAENRIRDQN
jgi:hypothetical protein